MSAIPFALHSFYRLDCYRSVYWVTGLLQEVFTYARSTLIIPIGLSRAFPK